MSYHCTEKDVWLQPDTWERLLTFVALELLAINSESILLSSCLCPDTSLLCSFGCVPNPLCATVFPSIIYTANKKCGYNEKKLTCIVFSQEAKISEIQISQRTFFLTFGPVIRKLFTDLEERKTTERNGDIPTHFCCQAL